MSCFVQHTIPNNFIITTINKSYFSPFSLNTIKFIINDSYMMCGSCTLCWCYFIILMLAVLFLLSLFSFFSCLISNQNSVVIIRLHNFIHFNIFNSYFIIFSTISKFNCCSCMTTCTLFISYFVTRQYFVLQQHNYT